MKIDWNKFAGGALAERLGHTTGEVLENLADPNTDPTKVRKVTLTISMKADEQRDLATVSIQAKSTLVPAKQIETKIVMDRNVDGQVVGQELKSGVKGQTYIDEEGDVAEDTGGKLIDYRQKGVK